MGPYCKYCDHRCFVYNPIKPGWLLATCDRGKQHDREAGGYDIDSVRRRPADQAAK